MSRLIIVSNRLPVTIEKVSGEKPVVHPSSGGLVAGLQGLHEENDTLWVGHCGVFQSESFYAELTEELQQNRLYSVGLKKKLYNGYYNGLSNGVIWPLFHYMPVAAKTNEGDWEAYEKVNRIFAEKVAELVQPGDRVWVQDYQLMLLPAMLRRMIPDLDIAYFLHIPFPSSEVFRILSGRVQILEGLLGADYIAFHTYDYARHFLSAVARLVGADTNLDELHYGGRIIKVAAHPLGVDYQAIQEKGESEAGKQAQTALEQRLRDQFVFLGIDRLDYTKGIPERILAFREFLRTHSEFVGKATLVQLCVPSRADIQTYGNLRANVERLVGQINGEFAKPGYTPVQYLYTSQPMEEVVALYKRANVALVTPLRDGLNLVCKEYVAARNDEDGVLILSELAGAAAEMGEAILVNPFDVKGMSHAMYQAAVMAKFERKRRMQHLRERVRKHDNRYWAKALIAGWNRLRNVTGNKSQELKGDVAAKLLGDISQARRFFLFADNDGTLTPIASRPELAIPSSTTRDLIREVCQNPKIEFSLITGRPQNYCDDYFGGLPITMVAEHGAYIKWCDQDNWQNLVNLENFVELKPDILRQLEMYADCVPGSHIEHKATSLVWHYRQAEPTFARNMAMELGDALQQVLGKTSMAVFHGKKTVEIRHVVANKGAAVEHILEEKGFDPKLDFMLTVGDDITDEDMHRAHADDNASVHIGQPNIYAKYYLASPEALSQFLAQIAALSP